MREIDILPTNTCPESREELAERTRFLALFADSAQLDIGDGEFVSVSSWPYREGQWRELESPECRDLFSGFAYEAHLMVREPKQLGQLLAQAGVARLLPHLEVFQSDDDIRRCFALWREVGAREVGLSVLIDTPLSRLEGILEDCSVIQLMSIARLGSQGAPFDARVYDRIRELHALHPALTIAVDGGVSLDTIEDLVRAGASRFGVGSAISKALDASEAYRELKKRAQSAIQ